MVIEIPKIVVFEPDSFVRKCTKAILDGYDFVREHYVVEAEDTPWNAKDQITLNTRLAIVGYSRGIRGWDALAYLRDAPEWLVSIAGSPSWSSEERDEFVRAGAIFTYDRPCSPKRLEVLVKTALKIGPFLKSNDFVGDEKNIVAVHISGSWGRETLSVRRVPK